MSYLSPWGHVDGTTRICRGVLQVYTESHGGISVTPVMMAKEHIPGEVKKEGIWYSGKYWFEEDCAWRLPLYFSPQIRRAYFDSFYADKEGYDYEDFEKSIRDGVKEWYPEIVEKYPVMVKGK